MLGVRSWSRLAVVVLLGHPLSSGLGAAEFKLLSSAVQPSATGVSTNTGPRFTLTQTQLAPVSVSVPGGSERFALQAQAGAVVLVQEAALPQLRLRSLGADLELSWEDQTLLAGLILESSTAAARGAWQAEACEVTPTGRRHFVRPSAQGSAARFYRLRKL